VHITSAIGSADTHRQEAKVPWLADEGSGLCPPVANNSMAKPTKLMQDESRLVTAAKAGGYEAFEELVNRYEKKIYRLGLNVTGSPEDAEDVLQETFLKAFVHLGDFREDARFYTWIVRIALNEGLMKLRKRRSDKAQPMEDVVNGEGEVMPREFTDWRPNPEEVFAQTELRTILTNAAQSLRLSFRTVFLLRDVEGLSTRETAQLLHLTEGTVKARLHRARLQLREELSKTLKREYSYWIRTIGMVDLRSERRRYE